MGARDLANVYRIGRMREDDLPAALVFVALGAFAFIVPAQNDTFWLLRSGREMWETGAFITREPFSHTSDGAPLHNHWWLSQLLFYAAFSAGGPLLLTLVAGACAWVAVLGSWRLVRAGFEVRVLLLAFLVLATAPEWAVRPQVVSLALLVLCAHLIASGHTRWLPVVCVVWGNAHGMVIFGVFMAGACALEALIWSRRHLIHDMAVAAASAVAPMISPLALDYWPRVLATVSMSRELQLHEYRMPLEWSELPFWLALAALCGLAIWRWRALDRLGRADRILLIAALGLGAAAIMAARNVAFFAVIAAPVLSRLSPLGEPRSRERPAGSRAYLLVGGAIVVAVALVLPVWLDGGRRLGWQPLEPGIVAAVRGCRGPIFNHLEDGGPLMWAAPEVPVFVDSRMEAYPLDLLRESRAADLQGVYQGIFLEHGINCAVVRTDSALAVRLATDPSMRAVHAEGARTVFERLPAAR